MLKHAQYTLTHERGHSVAFMPQGATLIGVSASAPAYVITLHTLEDPEAPLQPKMIFIFSGQEEMIAKNAWFVGFVVCGPNTFYVYAASPQIT